MNEPVHEKAQPVNSAQCPGVGRRAILDDATGFYGCPTCKAPQGVILRTGGYLVPDHVFGTIHREPGDLTFVGAREHAGMPALVFAAQNGLPRGMVIDLLARGIMQMQEMMRQMAEKQAKPEPRIILTGLGGNG